MKKIEKIIEEATLDCYDESECYGGWLATLEDEIETPQPCLANRNPAELLRIVGAESGLGVNALIKIGKQRLIVPVETIVLENKGQNAFIEAYEKWL
ncbi:MAG: hypothetical protein V1787_01675 [Candidatus Micrarchaeota archaeon]